MLQLAGNLVDEGSGALASKRYLIIDRDTEYTQQFRRLVEERGTEVIRLPPMSPNLNAYAERFVRSIKDECLEKMIFVGQGNRLIRPEPRRATNAAVIQRRPRLGGMLNYYYHAAA
jgi:transposase InsO family protein